MGNGNGKWEKWEMGRMESVNNESGKAEKWKVGNGKIKSAKWM